MTLNDINRKAGRPRNDEKVIQLQFTLPKLGSKIHIQQRKKDGNKKKLEWTGEIIGDTNSCLLMKLVSGVKESFDKNDFKFGILTYQYMQEVGA